MKHVCEFVGGGPADGNERVIKDHIMAFRFRTKQIPADFGREDQIVTVPAGKVLHHHIYLREDETFFFCYEGLD